MVPEEFFTLFQSKIALFTKYFADLIHPLNLVVQQLLCASDYSARHISILQSLLEEDDCQYPLIKADYTELVSNIQFNLSSHEFIRELRVYRHRYFLRLLLREMAGLSSTDETMKSWSDLADVLILHVLDYCNQQMRERYGEPQDTLGCPSKLFVLSMGKLGGEELNFSSDIDLIFAYTSAGNTNGAESLSNQEYYSKVVQQLIHILQTPTKDGFVFRVDLRLRPNGESGPLVCTLSAMETYYQEQGRDWERYAMVKARLIGSESNWFFRLITPFVYRKYVDFSVIESLRSMKAMIEREVQLNPSLDDIKRGRGGIREVEFIIQCFQLIRGGRFPSIQQHNAMAALSALKHEGLLAHTVALQQAYLFLRKLENALQSQNDKQVHSLPVDLLVQTQILLFMNYPSWDVLIDKLEQYRRIVSHAFHAVLHKPDTYDNEQRLLSNQLSSLWQGHVESSMAVNLLASLGLQEPERCYQMLNAFRHAPRCRRLTQIARMRLDRFMVLLLIELVQIKATDIILLQVIRLLENIVGRSAYLALLTENPPALQELLYWFVNSSFITTLLVNQPFLLEVLIDQQKTWRPHNRAQLAASLKSRIAHNAENEQDEEILRQFKLVCWLSAARAEFYGQCDAVRISKFLADVAEIIIGEVIHLACQQLVSRYPELKKVKSRFAIIAYGKLGSREMNYDSDVDLVFLHNASPMEEGVVTRLTQKILHMLTMRTQAGVLYAVDTRLRPSGEAGLLVSHVDAFVDYQHTHAWTWEHQALLKARVLQGSQRIKLAFNKLKKEVLSAPRDVEVLRHDVREMREKISKHLDHNAIKHVAGGLLDLEFLIQFLVLGHPQSERSYSTNTLQQLKQLYASKIIDNSQYSQLKEAYKSYHKLLHQFILQSCSFGSDNKD